VLKLDEISPLIFQLHSSSSPAFWKCEESKKRRRLKCFRSLVAVLVEICTLLSLSVERKAQKKQRQKATKKKSDSPPLFEKKKERKSTQKKT
jgi:hypothetical protein